LFVFHHQNGTKLSKDLGTCYVNKTKKIKIMDMIHGQKWAHWKLKGDEFHQVKTFGSNFLRYQAQIFNTTIAIYSFDFLTFFHNNNET